MHPDFIGTHFDFVKIFLSRATHGEFEEMQPYLTIYVNYFSFRKAVDPEWLMRTVEDLLYCFGMVYALKEELEPQY